MATLAGQDVFTMSRATHLADFAAARFFKLSELATMVALMVSLPLYSASVAKLGTASATVIGSALTYTTGSSRFHHSRHVITTLIPKHHFAASKPGLPTLLIREVDETLPSFICWTLPIMC
ncbi:hypothetical protein ACMFMG_011782 [Clarireedia jacksonii]